jgi:hypothetical protein
MKHARVMIVKAEEDVEPMDGDTAQVFDATPCLVFDGGGSSALVKDVSATMKCINTTESEIKEGERVLATQDVGGHWIISRGGGKGGVIEYKITSLTTKASGPYTGLKAAEAVIHGAPCGRIELIGTTVEVIDHSNELFDESSMVGFTGWASEMVFLSLDDEADCDTLTPCHWAAINRVCTADTGDYAAPCPPPE